MYQTLGTATATNGDDSGRQVHTHLIHVDDHKGLFDEAVCSVRQIPPRGS